MPEIRIISLGTKMPQWVNQAVENYLSRIPKNQFRINLIEIALIKRTNSTNRKKLLQLESRKVLDKVPAHFLHISLERTGTRLTSESLSQSMQNWLDTGQSVALSIGGPEGFPGSHFKQCAQLWSLSDFTLAHPVVRVVLAEQLYRGWSIMTGHPYHRGAQL